MSIWYHHTKPERINSILKFGLKPNSQNNKVEDGLGAEETIRELYKYGTPIFVTKDLNMFKNPGDVTLKLELKESELLPDFPSLIDSGAYVEEYGNSYILYWETSPDGKIDPYKEFDIEDEGSYNELIAVTNTASTFQEILPSKIKLMNESMNNLQKLIESEVLSLLNEASDEKLVKMNSLDFLLLTRMKPGDKENDPELQQKLNNLGLNNELNNLAWVNPVNLRKNYNEYINNDPLYLKFKLKDNGSYETIEHEGRHRNLGNLLANGKDASMNVVLKGDIPPSGTNVQRQGMEGGVPVELEYKETSNEKPPENLDDHLNKEIDLSNLFTIIKKIALDDIKKNKGEDEAALFSKSFGEFIKTFNENYGIKLKDLKGNEEFYELEVGGSFIKKLQLRDSAGANHGRSLNTTEGANVDENEAGSASNYTGTPYEATLVKKNISEGGSMNNLQEQILTEVMQLLESTNISEGMQYHLDNKIPITETIYRPLSDGFMRLMKEARTLHSLGLYEGLTEDEREILESDLGEVGVYEGQEVPLDLLMVEEEELDEAKYKGKDVKLNKPQRGGSKKFYVYVRDPKSGNIRKVSFGARGMSVKLNDPKRRKAFVDRHRCKEKKNKTTAGYWACRIGRYPHLFGGNTKYTWW